MSSNTKRAEDARQRGNELYRAAIKAYKLAATFDSSDPAPLSNLSAATFETGEYEKSIQYSTEALALLEQEADDDPRKQKLLTRLTKAKRYHCEPDDSIAKESLRKTVFRLPRYRPHLTNEKSYYPSGHDVPEPQYGPTLRRTTKNAPVVSLMFCGIGDARNMLQTILNYHVSGPKSHESDQRLHLTILDFKPAIIARDLILLALLDDISLTMGLTDDKKSNLGKEQSCQLVETLNVASYFYATQVMPAYAWDRIQAVIQRLLDCFDNSEQPISWVYVPVAVQATIRPWLESWKRGPTSLYSTQRFRELIKQHEFQTRMSIMSMTGGDYDPEQSFPHLHFDQRVYKNFSIVLPLDELLMARDPNLLPMIKDYRKNDNSVKERLSAHIDSQWKPNLTLADIVWENENTRPGSLPHPDMSFSPFEIIRDLMMGFLGEKGTSRSSGNTLMSIAQYYFMVLGKAISSLRDRMMVEVCFGEMAESLEQMQYQTFDRSTETESKDYLTSSKWPHKYHIIHMSNIPNRPSDLTEYNISDYVGGPFTSFLCGAPLLEYGPGTGLNSCNLRNPPQFETVSHFLSEYLLMYDRNLIRSHFQLKISSETPEETAGPMPTIQYLIWERVPQQPMTFEQLMPQTKLLHWLYAYFLKICLPYPRTKLEGDATMIFSPHNMTAFLRLVMRVSELEYPAHWISNLIESILSGKINTTARPPPRQVCTPRDVDTIHPTRSFSTTPWTLEFATLTGMWRSILRAGLVIASAVPRIEDIVEYTVKFPGLEIWDGRAPHSMLVFYDQQTFGKPPRNLRPILMDEGREVDPKSRKIRDTGLHCVSTFHWRVNAQEATFWMSKDAFESIKSWKVYMWRTDSWEKEGKGVKLENAAVKKKCWGEWGDPPKLM
ncbi:uncharacterized protein MELLADRAFT_117429 [Melampsora larici-populina 98AG31]|uniref:DUF4470 domain-containing protein n=1 Tax=Melampsora larici-populina (strain 98AG31 / pathotype 3-4-7) TaxID=747676 RepID=F4RX11_MELLP|nr:uncharacterized protein MELLADRAFT_117429 [Melampsora larici-populina 98AG31]EGG03114.1 hypothetical protein MELLADRAFT_117429 [Melampsora larici-populina 98AG31]